MLSGLVLIGCAEPAPPPPPAVEGPPAQVMQSREETAAPSLPYCDFVSPPLDGLGAGRQSWMLDGAWDKVRPREVMTVNARKSAAAGTTVLLLSCEARQDARGELLPGSRQWVATRKTDGSLGWSVQVGLADAAGRRWWTQPRFGSSLRVTGAIELSGRYEDVGETTSVTGRATVFVAAPVVEGPPPPLDCPYTRPMRAPESATLLVLDDVRIHAPAVDARDARLRTVLSGDGASLRLDERWNWPKGAAEFGGVVAAAREESFSFRAESKAAQGGFVHVCPSTLPPGAERGSGGQPG